MSNYDRSNSGAYTKDSSIYSIYHGTSSFLLEDELNESQWNQIERQASLLREQFSSGFLKNYTINAGYSNYFTINGQDTNPLSLLVNGYLLRVGSNNPGSLPAGITQADNTVIFKLNNAGTGVRTDLVMLEAWFETVAYQENLRKYGGADTPVLTSNIYDSRVNTETSRRIQLRWRVRVVDGAYTMSGVKALSYDGTTTAIDYSVLGNIYVADIGSKQYSGNGGIKMPGIVYGIPLFSVTRPANNNTIALTNITDIAPKSISNIADGAIPQSKIKGLPARFNDMGINVKDFGATGSIKTATVSTINATNQVVVSSIADFEVGQKVLIKNAGKGDSSINTYNGEYEIQRVEFTDASVASSVTLTVYYVNADGVEASYARSVTLSTLTFSATSIANALNVAFTNASADANFKNNVTVNVINKTTGAIDSNGTMLEFVMKNKGQVTGVASYNAGTSLSTASVTTYKDGEYADLLTTINAITPVLGGYQLTLADVTNNCPKVGTNIVVINHDNSDAFIAAIAYAESQGIIVPGRGSNKVGQVKIFIPPGTYNVVKSEALMRSSFSSRTVGLAFQGAGRGVTTVYYKNNSTGKYLLYNNDAWLFIDFTDIMFYSESANANFMYSYSNGGAQNYSFTRCHWGGNWNYIFVLEGGNNNSEWSWYHCGFSGNIAKGVYVPASGSDQFLNYNFYGTNFEVTTGDFLDFQKGGNINIWGGSLINQQSGTFFRLSGGTHSTGTARMFVSGVRFELKNANTKVIDSSWERGTIHFLSCVMGVQAGDVNLLSGEYAVFSSSSVYPNIKFESCEFQGKHRYKYAIGAYVGKKRIVYENCTFYDAKEPKDFIVTENTAGGANQGGAPVIDFIKCNTWTSNGYTYEFDTTLNWQVASMSHPTKKVMSIKNAQSAFPSAASPTAAFVLPLNAIVTRIMIALPAGSVSSGYSDWTFMIKTTETTPTTLAHAHINGPAMSTDLNYSTDLFYVCNSDAKRNMIFECSKNVDQAAYAGICLIEYLV